MEFVTEHFDLILAFFAALFVLFLVDPEHKNLKLAIIVAGILMFLWLMA